MPKKENYKPLTRAQNKLLGASVTIFAEQANAKDAAFIAREQIGRAHVCSSHSQISYAVFCLKKKKRSRGRLAISGYYQPAALRACVRQRTDQHAAGLIIHSDGAAQRGAVSHIAHSRRQYDDV